MHKDRSDTIGDPVVCCGMATIKNAIANLWESYLVRLTVLAAVLGAVPFYFLSLAVAQIGG